MPVKCLLFKTNLEYEVFNFDKHGLYLLLFADDAVLFSETCEGLQRNIDNLEKYWRVLLNSNIGVLNSNFLILTPTFGKVPIVKYRQNPTFLEIPHFYSNFQNLSENSVKNGI